jgi:preprotein translocase subunit Sec61beta
MYSTASASLASFWDELSGTQPGPEPWVVIAALVAAFAVVAPHRVWRVARNARAGTGWWPCSPAVR